MDLNHSEKNFAWVRTKFVQAREILDNIQQNGELEKEPYKHQYKAMEIFEEIEKYLGNILNTTSEPTNKISILRMLAVVHLNMGLISVNTEETKAGEVHFMACLDMLRDRESEPESIIPAISVLNQLGIIWSQWNQPEKAKNFLDRAEQLYKNFTNEKEPVNMITHFEIEDKPGDLPGKEVMEKLYTLTLYYLAQVFSMMKDDHRSATYCHMTLHRQLGQNNTFSPDLDYIDWALNAATLSQYFMENERITQARYHLAAASYIMLQYKTILKNKLDKEENQALVDSEWENYNHRNADIARCWGKYGILLLSLSKQRLMQETEKDDDNESKTKSDVEKKIESSYDHLKFNMLEKDMNEIMNQITDKYLLDFNDAKNVFLNVQQWLEQARKFYSLDGHTSDYVLIQQDMSQAYKYLVFYEDNEQRQAKMHKRRIDILESLIQELSPQHYQSACRQIWIELGETYSDILDIKLDSLRAKGDEQPLAHDLQKINHLTTNAIKSFQSFLDSLKNQSTNSMPDKFSEELMYPALCAYFHLGRLYNKLITPDKALQLENATKSMEAYKFVVNYCEKYSNATDMMKVELNISKEFVNLLPMKIEKLRRDLIKD